MNLQQLFSRVGVPAIGSAAVAAAYHFYGWQGVAVAATMLIMWALMHFNRLMQVLKRAANRPIGYVDSAVMLNAKLAPGMTLFHVIALVKALGELRSVKDAQPEVFRWTDAAQSHVTCEFRGGKLVKWELVRPEHAGDTP